MTKKISNILILATFSFSSYSMANTMGAHNIFGSSSTNDGPITVCSNSATYDQNTNTFVYYGNVLVIQVKEVNILCQPKNDNFPGLAIKDQPNFSFWIDPKDKNYRTIQSLELQKAKELCKKQGTCRYISGQKLTINIDPSTQKVTEIEMTVNNKEKNLTNYYSLSPKDKKIETTYTESSIMNFKPEQNLMILRGHAKINRDGNKFGGDKVVYNTKTQLVTVPNTGQRATMIIQNDSKNNSSEKSNETK